MPNQFQPNTVVRGGLRIDPVAPGKMLGRKKANLLIAAVNAFLNLRPVMTDSDEARFIIGDNSSALEIPSPSDAGSTSGTLEKLTLVAVYSDVLQCTDSFGGTVYVAKSTKLRNSIASETIDGTLVSYAYTGTYVRRTATGTGINETQIIVPRFLVGDILYAATIAAVDLTKTPGNTVSVTRIDVNIDARAWAQICS